MGLHQTLRFTGSKGLQRSMSYKTIEYQKDGNLAVIRVLGPDNDSQRIGRLADELVDICTEITWEQEIRAVVLLCADDRFLSMGPDPARLFSDEGSGRPAGITSLAGPVAGIDRPVIMAVPGDAVGQGLELALACDIRIGVETSRFGFPHVASGLIPWDGGTQRLSRLVGRSRALELLLTGETIDSREAFRIGLLNRVVSSKDLVPAVMEIGRKIALNSPLALRYAKEAVYNGSEMTLDQGLRLEADLYLLLHTTKDRTEGIMAFREKRTPTFESK